MVRVAVTTTAGRAAQRLGDLVADAGMQPVLLPCIRVEPANVDVLEQLRRAAAEADWIVVTSRRAVEIVWPGTSMPAGPAVAAVGAATADAVRRAGGSVEMIGTGGAAALRHELSNRVEGASVVFPHARLADPETEAWLEERAARVVAAPAYDTIPTAPGDDPVDVATFGSPSSVRGWTSSRSLDGLAVATMGETTGRYLRSIGHPPEIVPHSTGFEALVAAVVDHMQDKERSWT